VCANRIPHGRGLGSSSAAICAGIVLARALVAGGAELLSDEAALELASDLEGHPDNVAACLLGGVTIAWTQPGADGAEIARAVSVQPCAALRAVALIPTTTASTRTVRGLLPREVPLSDAVFNVSRAALAVAALLSHPDALFSATDDRLHQPYRASAMPESARLVSRLRAEGIPAMISGAGPTVIVLTARAEQAAVAVAAAPPGWTAQELTVERSGARIVRND
jgi:homoserine kinase